jgi:recombination protein RecA
MATPASAASARESATQTVLAQMDKLFGKGSVQRLGANNIQTVSVISTGSLALDVAVGVGGVPRGRMVEIYGPESSGKTTLALQVIAQAQKEGGQALFIDAEHAMDPTYARKLGVNLDDLLVSQPDHGEQALEIAAALVASNTVDVCVIDSVAALVPKAELEGDMGDSFMGLHARLMSQALRKLTGVVSRTNTCLVFINQVREKIGVVFGNPETTTGGRALKFYASLRLEVRRGQPIKDGDLIIGNRTKVKVVKNKVAPPFREVELEMIHGEGTSLESELLDLGATHGLVEKSGSWFSFRGERLGQGREQARLFLKENTAIKATIEAELRSKLGIARNDAAGKAMAASAAAASRNNVATAQ